MKRHIPLLLLTLLCFLPGHAQDRLKFSVVDFQEDQFDYSAMDRLWEKYDGNGDRYAIIKITSVNPNDKLNEYAFDFGMQMSLDCHSDLDERWIYVEKFAKYVTVTRGGYVPIKKLPLNTTIQPGKVYTMVLNSEAPVLSYQMVQFNVTPANSKAMIFVKNELTDEETTLSVDDSGAAAESLLFGSYTYRVVAPKYYQSDGAFLLDDKLETLVEEVKLRPNFSEVTLQAGPGVEIYVNGKLYGTGSWAGQLKSGSYSIECRKEDHIPSRETLIIQDHDDRTFDLPLPTPITGILSINSTPLGAKILIDGQDFGVTPKNIDVVIGKHTIAVSKEGYRSDERMVDVVKDHTEQLNFSLSNVGNVIISTDPAKASIIIDGERVEGTSPVNYEGEIGEHTLRLNCNGYLPLTKKFNIENGEPANLVFAMQKSLVKKNCFYVQAGFDVGTVMGPEVTIGGTVANVLLQAGLEYGITRSGDIYWESPNLSDITTAEYYPKFVLYGSIGYNFSFSGRYCIAPIAGYRFTTIDAKVDNKEDLDTYCGSLTIGARTFIGITSHIGVAITPMGYIKVDGPKGYNKVAKVSSRVRGFGSGFSCNIAVCVKF